MLKNDEAATDAMYFKIADLVPVCKQGALDDMQKLDDKFANAIEVYGS